MLLKTIESYRLNLRNAVRGLWNGEMDYLLFYEQMQLSIDRGFTQAWTEGLAMAGIKPDEASDMELQTLRREIVNERIYIDGFANYIEANSKERSGKLEPLYQRAEFWINGYTRVLNLAYVMASGDKKLKWQLNPAEHCSSCKKLSGKIKRSSYWSKHGVYPKAWDKLNCRQKCQCSLVETSEPLSRGPLPGLP